MTYLIILHICVLGTNPGIAPCSKYRSLERFQTRQACVVRGVVHMARVDALLRAHRLESYYECRAALGRA